MADQRPARRVEAVAAAEAAEAAAAKKAATPKNKESK